LPHSQLHICLYPQPDDYSPLSPISFL
jgi:hypothetical protein